MKKISLPRQLIYIVILIIGIIFITLGIILPKELLPIYEENIYNRLKQPLSLISDMVEVNTQNIENNTDIAYLVKTTDKLYTSYNIDTVINDFSPKIINYMTKDYGKFIYKNHLYYYYTHNTTKARVISITDDSYINNMKKDILYTIFIVVGLSFALCSLILVLWSNNLVNNIIILKRKIKNIDNDNYNIAFNHKINDEIYSLNESIENMREYLKKNEIYKNQMYQNISHDFKTPITVIKSYIEASEDGMETQENCLKIIKEQTNLLENKVHSLLYLNKLNYIKDKKENLKQKTDISLIINSSIEKFKKIRPDLTYTFDILSKEMYRGTPDMWETIIDNLLNNFMRYAKKEIKITLKSKKLILSNDGEAIDEKFLDSMFSPYEKGLNGMFGLGLSIVKKTLNFLNYDIFVENVKDGVNFIIKEERL